MSGCDCTRRRSPGTGSRLGPGRFVRAALAGAVVAWLSPAAGAGDRGQGPFVWKPLEAGTAGLSGRSWPRAVGTANPSEPLKSLPSHLPGSRGAGGLSKQPTS